MGYDQRWVEVRLPLLLLPLLPPSLHYQLTSHQGSSAPLRAALLYVLCPLGIDRHRLEGETKKKEKLTNLFVMEKTADFHIVNQLYPYNTVPFTKETYFFVSISFM